KLIICDLNDANFDSGIFLKSKSFRSIPATFDTKKIRFKKFVFNFEVASVELSNEVTSAFADVGEFFTKNKIDSVIIVGHSDSTGIEDSNMVLSLNRAGHVKQLLIITGIPEDKIKTRGKGSKLPVQTNATLEGRMLNRRVEIYFYKR
ncbi:MAG: OmpA family protein, partial [Bacteroidia bacterium]